VSAVGKMREILGVGVGLVLLSLLGVESAGKKVVVSHFSPTEAMEEI
jgi:hypothetical protein